MSENSSATTEFDDLLEANEAFASDFALGGFDGIAQRGVAVITCMDSRIDPLGMLGLSPGDAKIFRNPGGRVTAAAMEALVLGVHLLNVNRILIVPHTKCAMTQMSEVELREVITEKSGADASWIGFHVVPDQAAALKADVAAVKSHPLIPDSVAVGGFLYNVDDGKLDRRA